MSHISWSRVGLALGLALTLLGSVAAQQPQPGGAPVSPPQPAGAGTAAPTPAPTMVQIQDLVEDMQELMEDMQELMEDMQRGIGRGSMRGHRGMMGQGGMPEHRGMGMMAREQDDEDDDEEAAPRRKMGRRGGMALGRMRDHGRMMHLDRLTQHLSLTAAQQTQVRTLLRTHAKDAIRLRADRAVLAIEVQQMLDTDPIDLTKIQPALQSMAGKEADLHFAHATLVQEIQKLLTPEQQQQFRPLRARLMGHRGMMGHGGMMGH